MTMTEPCIWTPRLVCDRTGNSFSGLVGPRKGPDCRTEIGRRSFLLLLGTFPFAIRGASEGTKVSGLSAMPAMFARRVPA